MYIGCYIVNCFLVHKGTMISNASQLVTGNVGGALQLWSMDTAKSPSVSLNKTIELDGAVFSSTFDSNMELVNI